MPLPTILEAKSEDEFVRRGTELFIGSIREAIDARGQCVVGLSGGSTPRKIYAHAGMDRSIDWSKVWLFLVDERHIEPTADDANMKLISDTFLQARGLQADHVIAPDTSLPIDACVQDYGNRLQTLFTEHGTPDVITLGLGEDGHVASLFPPLPDSAFGPALAIHTETDRFAVHHRISITLPTLRQTPVALFFIKGEGKHKVWKEMMEGDDVRRWPGKEVMEFGQTTMVLYA